MQEVIGDFWQEVFSAPGYSHFVIPINLCLKPDGKLVMGAGLAKRAAELWPELPSSLGGSVRLGDLVAQIRLGNPRGVAWEAPKKLISFPTKPGPQGVPSKKVFQELVMPMYHERFMKKPFPMMVPGWAFKSTPQMIADSAMRLRDYVANRWDGGVAFLLPEVGCGNGGLPWSEVKGILNEYLGNRFFVVHKRKK